MEPQIEKLPSGKTILRQFSHDGLITYETHSYGLVAIAITLTFHAGTKVEELYFAKRRMVSRRTYEKARLAYPDMPDADSGLEDVSGGLLTDLRREQRRRKADAERRLAASVESKFPRPNSTNWLRIISCDHAFLLEFASRDWKLLAREQSLPSGNRWLDAFGFDGPLNARRRTVMEGPIVGYETVGKREEMIAASRALLAEINHFTLRTRDPSWGRYSVRKAPKPRKPKAPIWAGCLPSVIDFLERITTETVIIFNHHR